MQDVGPSHGRGWLAVGLLALAGVVPPAQAAVAADVRVGQFVVTLTDRRPDDGVAPSLQVAGGHSALQGVVFSRPGWAAEARRRGEQQFGSLSETLQVENVRLEGGIVSGSAEQPWEGASLWATGRIEDGLGYGLEPGRYLSMGVVSQDDVFDEYSFWLSPFTSVSFTAVAQLSVEKTSAATLTRENGETVNATASLYLVGPGFDTGRSARLELGWSDGPQTLARSANLFAGYTNATADPVRISLRASVGVDAVSLMTSPVPEPASWALMLGGIGWLARQRLRQAKR